MLVRLQCPAATPEWGAEQPGGEVTAMELLVGRQLIVIVVLILAVLIALWILASTRRSQR
jgi:hypothetical protein